MGLIQTGGPSLIPSLIAKVRFCNLIKSRTDYKLFAYWVFFHTFVIVCQFLSKLFQKNYFRNNIRLSNGLDQDYDQNSVSPDSGPNCLQRLSMCRSRNFCQVGSRSIGPTEKSSDKFSLSYQRVHGCIPMKIYRNYYFL